MTYRRHARRCRLAPVLVPLATSFADRVEWRVDQHGGGRLSDRRGEPPGTAATRETIVVALRSSRSGPGFIKMSGMPACVIAADVAVAGAAVRLAASCGALGVADPPETRPRARTPCSGGCSLSVSLRRRQYRYCWATWNPDGTFASMYVRESIGAYVIPVLPHYQLLQSKPAVGSGEIRSRISLNLHDRRERQPLERLSVAVAQGLALRRTSCRGDSYRA